MVLPGHSFAFAKCCSSCEGAAGMTLLVVLVAYLELCSANVRQQWPQPPLRRTRHHCNACFLDESPHETCDFRLERTCTEKAGCLRPDARCLEAPLHGSLDFHMRCCCLPENGVTSTSLCSVVNFFNVPFRFQHCILKCCEYHNCGNGCAAKEEGCGDALPPFEGPCRIVANATAAEQTTANCCLWSKGVSSTSSQQEPCCLEAAVHPGQVCQATQAACMIKPTISPLPASDSGLSPGVCVVVVVLFGLVAGVVVLFSRRQPGHAGRERLLREAGPAVSHWGKFRLHRSDVWSSFLAVLSPAVVQAWMPSMGLMNRDRGCANSSRTNLVLMWCSMSEMCRQQLPSGR